MRITNKQPAILQRLLLVTLLLCLGGACGDKKESKGKTTAGAASESGATATGEGDKPITTNVDLSKVDVSFLVDPCVDSGEAEEKCRCAGEEAKTIIGPKILEKMSKAPADDDPAIQKYYSILEMQQIMNWVNDAGVKCGIEEEE